MWLGHWQIYCCCVTWSLTDPLQLCDSANDRIHCCCFTQSLTDLLLFCDSAIDTSVAVIWISHCQIIYCCMNQPLTYLSLVFESTFDRSVTSVWISHWQICCCSVNQAFDRSVTSVLISHWHNCYCYLSFSQWWIYYFVKSQRTTMDCFLEMQIVMEILSTLVWKTLYTKKKRHFRPSKMDTWSFLEFSGNCFKGGKKRELNSTSLCGDHWKMWGPNTWYSDIHPNAKKLIRNHNHSWASSTMASLLS